MNTEPPHPPPMAGRAKIAWGVFATIAFFYLWTEHRAHLLGVLPYLLLLACPIMHRFMHHGHGSHGAHPPVADKDSGDAP